MRKITALLQFFRIFRRKISVFSPCGDRFCLGKICGRSWIAPTTTFFDTLSQGRPKGRP